MVAEVKQEKNTSISIADIKKEKQLDKEKQVDNQTIRKDVILFFSFDIVNSSIYKSINNYGWSLVLSLLLKRIREEVNELMCNAELWRVLGDEAIFIVRITNKDQIYEYVDYIYKVLINIVKEIKSGMFVKELNDRKTYNNLNDFQNIISLKSSAWLAIVKNIGDIIVDCYNSDYENISTVYDVSTEDSKQEYKFYEFLGNDIDTGFRISKYTSDRRLVISFELAYILSQRTSYLSNLNIITFKKMKGIWENRHYPIIWYYNESLSFNEPFENSFYYDEEETDDLVKEYFTNRNSNTAVLKECIEFDDIKKTFKKILKDRNLTNKIEKITNLISTDSKDSCGILAQRSLTLQELHCAALCYNDKNEILIARRTEKRSCNPGKWEFGCAKSNFNDSIEQCLIYEYKEDFNVEIKPVLDENRTMKQPIPLAIYEVEKDHKKYKGIIVLAEIQGNYTENDFKPTDKHDKIKFIREEELDKFEEEAVPDFKNSLIAGFKYLKEKLHKDEASS